MVSHADGTVSHPDFPHVYMDPGQVDRLTAALAYSDTLPPGVEGTLRERLAYLEGYGADGDERRYRIVLGHDWAPHSFGVAWFQRRSGDWAYAWNGGLICHCSGTDPSTVSLTQQAWGIHT